MAKRKKPPVKKTKNVTVLAKGKTREEEERFYDRFSARQLNAVLLLILATTFLVQGIMNYLEMFGMQEFVKPWLTWILFSLLLLISSVVTITLGGILFPLKVKREVNIISFISFIFGFIFFIVALFFLLFIILLA
ncbi:hypothetical protein CL614_03230 [archaeon]|nr:hypothetical protein [archaeon]|tara:strand:+ start:1245 stop:1649 length:405 start_codon:yes stop_codon:yes gene_type:complete